MGAITEPDRDGEVNAEYPSINRITTLSSLRQRAKQAILNNKPVLDETAPQNEKTEAEILFEESLLNGKKDI